MADHNITLLHKIDALKSNWYVWACEKEGVAGTVQADFTGELIAPETFEAD